VSSVASMTSPETKTALRFRGRSFLALSLAPSLPLDAWLVELDAWSGKSPGFFCGRAVILDVAGLSLGKGELAALVSDLADRDIRIMAMEGADPDATPLGIPPAIAGGRPATMTDPPAGGSAKTQPPRAAALVLEEPVRSGQVILHPAGDVIVIGSVASGAEIVAGGSIHVYGALRGRAIAGISGQPGARIFCRKLQAELLAIDGLYKTADDIDADLQGMAVKVGVVEDALVVSPLD
jgi:septum site-determining protein MinC